MPAARSMNRDTPLLKSRIDALLVDDLAAWKAALAAHGYPRPPMTFCCVATSAVRAHPMGT